MGDAGAGEPDPDGTAVEPSPSQSSVREGRLTLLAIVAISLLGVVGAVLFWTSAPRPAEESGTVGTTQVTTP